MNPVRRDHRRNEAKRSLRDALSCAPGNGMLRPQYGFDITHG
jgi:phage baseplate assembly protein W